MSNQPKIEVGIMVHSKIEFLVNGRFKSESEDIVTEGEYSATLSDKKIHIESGNGGVFIADSFILIPENDTSFFELKGVTIGVDFHWEQKENQRFGGILKLIPEGGNVRAINVIDLEDYLKSVISSEM
ncbi:MAG: SpoIID/LytB domain-containing protein, partial [Bacteroidota bacterium]